MSEKGEQLKYNLDGFGLDLEKLDQRFHTYRERFSVPRAKKLI